MGENAEYVRRKLDEAKKEKGRIAQIVRAVEVDRRTLNKLADLSHVPHAATVDKLAAYFKRESRRAKA